MKEFLTRIKDAEIRNILAVMVTLGCFMLLYFFVIKEMPQQNKDVLLLLAGAMSTSLQSVLSYYFGASKDQQKDKQV
jgi:hypothetical protein